MSKVDGENDRKFVREKERKRERVRIVFRDTTEEDHI